MENTSKGAIIRELIRYGALSRPEIARRTNLSRSVITLSTIELMREGIIQKSGTGTSTGGRRPDEFRLGGGDHVAIGIALEDEVSIVSLYTLDGTPVDSVRTSFESFLKASTIVSMVTEQVHELRQRHPGLSYLGAGLALPSLADAETDLVTSMTFDIPGVPLRPMVTEAIGLPVNVLDNAHAAALGELWIRGRELRENLVYLYVGRGVGGAIIVDRELYLGRNHAAGEFGRQMVGGYDIDGDPFFGQLELMIWQRTMIPWVEERRARYPESALPTDMQEHEFIDVIGRHAAQGDALALRTIRQIATYTAAGSSNLINSLNPDELIIGGPMAVWGEEFVRDVYEQTRQWTIPVPYESVRIIAEGSREETIPLGAAATIIRRAPELLARH